MQSSKVFAKGMKREGLKELPVEDNTDRRHHVYFMFFFFFSFFLELDPFS